MGKLKNKNNNNKTRKSAGRPPYILNKSMFVTTIKKVESGEISNIQAMQILNMCKTNYYKLKKIYKTGGIV